MRSGFSHRWRRARKPQAPGAFHPWPCVVLAVDPGAHCGVAMYMRGKCVESGFFDGFDVTAIWRWLGAAQCVAQANGLPLLLAMEAPPMGGAPYPGRSPEGVGSMIGCRKVWLYTWQERAAIKRLRCDVYPVTWRARVLGLTRGPLLETTELLHGSRLAGNDVKSRDQAAAVCIGAWASHAPEVGRVLGPKWNGEKPAATRKRKG